MARWLAQARLGRRTACGFALPPALPARAWLWYYAARFDTVELNSSFTRFLRRARGLGGALGPVLIELPSSFHLRLDAWDSRARRRAA